uniref:Aquaporin-3 n=1 Tax=Milnesium tardigradum TaxID=46460 RepID=AQP3_MILTA|nr:RecName: Full=Aquaporin-3; Short=AQP-3 [Milnesium tardigradum]AEP14557.1 aquaporin 3 [Milnesium tardigradum]
MAISWRTWLKKTIHCDNSYVRTGLAEFLGTFLLVLLLNGMIITAHMSVRNADGTMAHPLNTAHLAFGGGLAVMVAVLVSGGISGAHLNPAVTTTMLVMGRLSPLKSLVYIFMQYMGAFFAASILYAVYFESILAYDYGERQVLGANGTAGWFATYPQEHISLVTQIFDAILGTGLLVMGIFAIIDPNNMAVPKGQIPLYVGFLISSLIFSFSYNAGAALNPARDLAPRLFLWVIGYGAEAFTARGHLWWLVPVIGPHVGGLLGGVTYQMFIGAHYQSDRKLKPATIMDEDDDTNATYNTITTTTHQKVYNGRRNFDESVPLKTVHA